MDYAFEHEGKVFTPNGTQGVTDAATHNAALEAEELATWATKPDRHVVYVVKRGEDTMGCAHTYPWYVATAWTGVQLSRGRVAVTKGRNNLTGAALWYVHFTGTNGAEYYGRFSADWSQACRVRRCK